MNQELQYNLDSLPRNAAHESICKKQQKLIQLLQTQTNMYRGVIKDMQNDIVQFQSFVTRLASHFHVDYQLEDSIKISLDKFIDELNLQVQKLNYYPSKKGQNRQLIKEVPVYIEREIQVIKQIEKPILVEKIVEIQRPIIVEKIIQLPCITCNRNQQKYPKT